MNVTERLKLFVAQKGISQYRLAKDSGVPQSTVSKIFTRNKGFEVDTLSLILNAYPELNADWLLTGRGEMLLKLATAV
jgi:transcriptional regulator with XRE-family HTH domain